MNVRKVSVICPVFNEEKFIEACLVSIIEQDYPQDMMEVLFVDGRSTDKTREIIERYMKQYPFIKLLDNPERIVPYALNRGLEAAKGEVIMRLDGHCTYPTNYISLSGHRTGFESSLRRRRFDAQDRCLKDHRDGYRAIRLL